MENLPYYSGNIPLGVAPSPAGTWEGNTFTLASDGSKWQQCPEAMEAGELHPSLAGTDCHYLVSAGGLR